MSAQQLIQQQYYTREREGIFRSNEGYDTIAKSPRLDNNFIKKTLHPFCTYDAPKELQERSNKDISQYPESLVFFQPESGEMIIGRSVYAGADFTGQRNTFFMHNYIVPRERKEEFIQNPATIFQIKDFRSTYNISNGKELPESREIAHGNERCLYNWRPVFEKLGITEPIFKQLLYAVMMSIASRKKVFISLDVDVTESSLYAKKLLEVLFYCLPYELRRHFGCITYSNEPESKKYIHVMFVEKGSIRPGARELEKDYMFDFPNQRFMNADFQGNAHTYLQFVWDKLTSFEGIEPFYAFAEEALQGTEDIGKKLALSTYYELCLLFLIEQGQTQLYEKNKAGVLHAILSYLNSANLVEKKRIHTLFLQLLEKESKAVEYRTLPSLEIIKCFINYYRIAHKAEKLQILRFFIRTLSKGKKAKEQKFVSLVYQSISENKQLFNALMVNILHSKTDQSLFEEYVEQRLRAVAGVEGVVQEIEFWQKMLPVSITNPYFMRATLQALIESLEQETDKVGSVVHIHESFERLNDKAEDKLAFSKYTSEVLAEIDTYLIDGIELTRLSREQCTQAMDILKKQKKTFTKNLGLTGKRNHQILQVTGNIFSADSSTEPKEIFEALAEEDIVILQTMLRRILKNSISSAHFKEVPYAFYNSMYDHSAKGSGMYMYSDMLQYIYKNKDANMVHDFIKWSLERHTPLYSGTVIPKPYRHAIKKHLIKNDSASLKKRAGRKKWNDIANRDFKKLFEEARDEASSQFVRFFRNNRKKIVFMILFVVLLCALGFALYKIWPEIIQLFSPDQKPKK